MCNFNLLQVDDNGNMSQIETDVNSAFIFSTEGYEGTGLISRYISNSSVQQIT